MAAAWASSRSLKELSNGVKCFCSCSWCCIHSPSVAPAIASLHSCVCLQLLSEENWHKNGGVISSMTLLELSLAGGSLGCWTLSWACCNLCLQHSSELGLLTAVLGLPWLTLTPRWPRAQTCPFRGHQPGFILRLLGRGGSDAKTHSD